MDFRGFDSNIVLILRGGILRADADDKTTVLMHLLIGLLRVLRSYLRTLRTTLAMLIWLGGSR